MVTRACSEHGADLAWQDVELLAVEGSEPAKKRRTPTSSGR
jgi:hypothetical protein